MQFDNPKYRSTRICPAEGIGHCPHLPTPEAVVDHLLADHDPQLVATLLVREAYISGRITDVLESLGVEIEKEVNALIPDPLSDDTPMEIQFGS